MQYRYQKSLQEIYDEYLEKHKQTGVKPYPDKLLALLLLQEKDKYEPEHLVNGDFYNKYKKEINERIEKVITDFDLTEEDIINFIEQKGIYYKEENYEHDKIWFVFFKGFCAVINTQRWHPSYTNEKAYDEYYCCFHGQHKKEKTNTRKRTLTRYKQKRKNKNGY